MIIKSIIGARWRFWSGRSENGGFREPERTPDSVMPESAESRHLQAGLT
jgi:hypothetical protein